MRACGRSSSAATTRRRSARPPARPEFTDRKSTRLNSSYANTSYAVFCLKKTQPSFFDLLLITPHSHNPRPALLPLLVLLAVADQLPVAARSAVATSKDQSSRFPLQLPVL